MPASPLGNQRRRRSAAERLSTLRRLGVAWIFGVAGLSLVAFQTAVPAHALLLDPAVVGGGHWYSGVVTSLIVLGWATAAVSSGLSAYACWVASRRGAAQMMGWICAIVTLLLFDDMLQLHSNVVPRFVGGSNWGLVVVEAVLVAAWSVRWIGEIVRTRWELLIAACAGFVASLFLDRFPIGSGQWSLVFEDGAKALGVLALATWAVSCALDLIGSLVDVDDGLRSGGASPIVESDRDFVSPTAIDHR